MSAHLHAQKQIENAPLLALVLHLVAEVQDELPVLTSEVFVGRLDCARRSDCIGESGSEIADIPTISS